MDPQQGASVKSSFFDDAEPEKYIFWKNEPPKSPSENKIIEGILFQRCSDALKPQYFILYNDRLAFFKEEDTQGQEEQGYCIVKNMRLESLVEQFDNGSDEQKDEKYGFRLTRNKQAHDLFAGSRVEQDKWIEALTKFCVLTQYSYYYSNVKVIGQGRFAWVNLGRRKSDGVEFAVKTFSKERLLVEDKAQASLINEINIMRQLDHDSIIKFYKIYESDRNIYLVLELLNGGELFERIVQKGQYNESDACILMGKLLGALAHMHSKGIMHRDIKPENLILKDTENDWNVKIADFGLAQVINADNYLFKRCGTPGYVAPELLADQKYGDKVDVFSAGLILYILLTGGSPFYSENYEEILWKNQNCDISFKFQGHRISPPAIDLMKKMLAKDPNQRISADEALQHEWIVTGGTFLSPKSNNPVYLLLAQENMKKFQESHGLNHKPQNNEKDLLERSVHAPSPLITGRVEQISEAQNQFIFNSPEMMSIGTALANRQALANMKSPAGGRNNANNNNNTRNMFVPRDGNMNGQMMNNNNRNTNSNKNPRAIKQYTGIYANQTPKVDMSADMAAHMTAHMTPKTAPIGPKQFQGTDAQKAMNVHQNFVKYLHMHSPQTQMKPRFSMNQATQDPQQQYYQQQQQQNQFQQFQQMMQPQFQPQPQPQYQAYQHHQFLQQYIQHPNKQQYQQAQMQPQYPQQQQQQQMQQMQPQFQPQPQNQPQMQPQMQQQMQPQFQPQPQYQQQYPQQKYKPSSEKAKNVTQSLKNLQ